MQAQSAIELQTTCAAASSQISEKKAVFYTTFCLTVAIEYESETESEEGTFDGVAVLLVAARRSNQMQRGLKNK